GAFRWANSSKIPGRRKMGRHRGRPSPKWARHQLSTRTTPPSLRFGAPWRGAGPDVGLRRAQSSRLAKSGRARPRRPHSQLFLFAGLSRLENSTMTRKSRGWLIASAILSILVGLVALSSPLLFSVLTVQLLGAFAFASGLISLFLAIFGKDVAPRGFNAL